jgi:two-component system, sensor histidine kinase ChiS
MSARRGSSAARDEAPLLLAPSPATDLPATTTLRVVAGGGPVVGPGASRSGPSSSGPSPSEAPLPTSRADRPPVILVIDDNRQNLRLLRDLLVAEGYSLRAAPTPELGLAAARSVQPDIILMDVLMPRMDGFEACRRLKADPATSSIPVIFMTALTETGDKLRAFEAGGVDFVTKPFAFPELMARLATQIRLSRLQGELQRANDQLERRVATRTQELHRTNEALSRFVPDAFLRALGRDILTARVGDSVHGEYTVMFADIREHTRRTEALGAAATHAILCAFFARVGPIVNEHGGYVCQFLGDGMMACFPSAEGAMRAAMAQHQAVDRLHEEVPELGGEPLAMGVGLSTGPLTLGMIGDAARLNPSFVGDTVNVASRMEGLSKTYGVRVAMSGSTARAAAGAGLDVRFVDQVRVAGKVGVTEVYDLVDAAPPALRWARVATLPDHAAGCRAVEDGRFGDAVKAFTDVLQGLPGDKVASIWLKRATRCLLRGAATTRVAEPAKR